MSLYQMKKIMLALGTYTVLFNVPLYAHYEQTQPAKVDILLKTQHSWDRKPYIKYPNGFPELSVLHFKLKPNSILPLHHDPYPNAGYNMEL